MQNWEEKEETGHCTGEKDLKDAIDVCRNLDIPLKTVQPSNNNK